MKGYPKLSEPEANPARVRRRALLWAAWLVAPGVAALAVLVIQDDAPFSTRLLIGLGGLAGMGIMARILGRHLLFTLDTVFALLASLREGDYGLRGHEPKGPSPLQGLVAHVNLLSDDLRAGRRKRTEASRLLGKTLVALNSAVFVIDDEHRLRLVNPAGRRLLAGDRGGLIGQDVARLGLEPVLAVPDDTILQHQFATASGRWAVRRAVWHSEGREHTMVMLHDLSAALSEEERRAWQRLLRVLSHELNNSLTPIGSLAESLTVMLDIEDDDGSKDVLREGLDAIGRRAGSLARFLSGYGRLARLPPLQQRIFRLDESLARLARLEHRLAIDVTGTAPVTIRGDEDQLGQAFINLLRNAVEATLDTGGRVWIDWRVDIEQIVVCIVDEGIGLPTSDGLFVPFFTTKPQGSGIGLTLTRLIVEAHGGQVDLVPRREGPGAVANVRLPRVAPERPLADTGVHIRTTA
ncbi:sensor histidine kinase [Luteibacter sahnii]|uniref:sensor histidine kinase n=1 Tax=Luteibacter sahnii TaxID=3021977 RepID=UPI002A6B5061|nr:ATP-binding protein [Luteibacter sp. PPL193]MDY1548780.1 ATP-binding protein [Luteibacter sp. PPL193]